MQDDLADDSRQHLQEGEDPEQDEDYEGDSLEREQKPGSEGKNNPDNSPPIN